MTSAAYIWRRCAGVHLRLDDADRDAEDVVDRLHPERVAAGEVVVDGDDVDAVAGERVEEDGAWCWSASCPRRSSSPRSRRSGGPCRRSAGRRSGAGRSSASPPRGRGRRPREGGRRASRRPRGRGLRSSSARSRISASSSSSSSGSKRLIVSTRFSYSLNFRPSPTRSALSMIPLPGMSNETTERRSTTAPFGATGRAGTRRSSLLARRRVLAAGADARRARGGSSPAHGASRGGA